jgi:hypothetical protein
MHRGLAALTNDDLVNIEIGLAVSGLTGERSLPMALRIFGRNLARVLGTMSDTWKPRSIAELAAPWFICAALDMEVVGTVYVGAAPYMAPRLRIRHGSGFDGIPVDDFRVNTRVAAIHRAATGTSEFPPGETRVCRQPLPPAGAVARAQNVLVRCCHYRGHITGHPVRRAALPRLGPRLPSGTGSWRPTRGRPPP